MENYSDGLDFLIKSRICIAEEFELKNVNSDLRRAFKNWLMLLKKNGLVITAGPTNLKVKSMNLLICLICGLAIWREDVWHLILFISLIGIFCRFAFSVLIFCPVKKFTTFSDGD